MQQYVAMTKTSKSLGEFVASIRKSRELSTRGFGKLLGVNNAYVTLIEGGRYKFPTDFVRRLMPLLTTEEKKEVLDIMYEVLKEEIGL